MSSGIYANLKWLPTPPASFAGGLPTASAGWVKLQRISLSGNQLARLAKSLSTVRRKGSSLRPLTPFRLGLLSNSTSDFMVPALEAAALRYGIALCVAQRRLVSRHASRQAC
jgi:hypothetical protein